jgi:hypothetical protein
MRLKIISKEFNIAAVLIEATTVTLYALYPQHLILFDLFIMPIVYLIAWFLINI